MFYDSEPLVPPEQNHSCSGGGPNISTFYTFPSFQSEAPLCREGQGTDKGQVEEKHIVFWKWSMDLLVDTIMSITSPVLWMETEDLRVAVKSLKSQGPHQSSFCPFRDLF